MGYDSVGRMTNLQHLGVRGSLQTFTNVYDVASRITVEHLFDRFYGASTTTYAYDITNQLTNDSVVTYSYDLNGNRTMSGYSTGQANQWQAMGSTTATPTTKTAIRMPGLPFPRAKYVR